MVILIPAYEPDGKLVELIRSIRSLHDGQPIVIVDDGSGPDYEPVFDAVGRLGCDVLVHPANRGKGAALKTGFAHIARTYRAHDVVCADCDGQHRLADIVHVADVTGSHRGEIVLGARAFDGEVPLRSRFGNSLTRSIFGVLTGARVGDTQTGLRGYPAWMLSWLAGIPGERFEYELEVLLAARRLGIGILEAPIETVYLDGNRSSHFDPVRDSIRVYLPLLRFAASGLASFALDAVLLLVLMGLTGNLLVSVVAARVVSASANFAANRTAVFADRAPTGRSARRYLVLAATVMMLNYLVLAGLTQVLSVPLAPAKLFTEAALFALSFHGQRRYVFANPAGNGAVAATPADDVGRAPVDGLVDAAGRP